MKLMRLSLGLMSFCFLNGGYAMENNKKQIINDLSKAKVLVEQAELTTVIIRRSLSSPDLRPKDRESMKGSHEDAESYIHRTSNIDRTLEII